MHEMSLAENVREIIEDASIRMVVGAAVPCERAPVAREPFFPLLK